MWPLRISAEGPAPIPAHWYSTAVYMHGCCGAINTRLLRSRLSEWNSHSDLATMMAAAELAAPL